MGPSQGPEPYLSVPSLLSWMHRRGRFLREGSNAAPEVVTGTRLGEGIQLARRWQAAVGLEAYEIAEHLVCLPAPGALVEVLS